MSESHTVVGCNCLCCQTEREEEREEAGDVSPNLRKSPSLSAIFGSQWEGNEDTAELQFISGTN